MLIDERFIQVDFCEDVPPRVSPLQNKTAEIVATTSKNLKA